jgi:hypothetical protein
MLGSRRRHASITRKQVPVLWPTESDAEQGRSAMRPGPKPTVDYGAAMQSHDRNHRPSRRPDASGNQSASSASSVHILSPDRDQSYATAQSHYPTTTTAAANINPTHPAMAAVASSRVRPPDLGQESYDLRVYLKKKTADRRSPRSSEEKLYAPEKQSRSRTAAYPTTTAASAQPYYTTAAQPSRDPVVPQRDRDRHTDRERAEARERRKQEKEAARARIEEEKARVRAYERERERARERRREEKELQRAEREREKEQERRREEKELERRREEKEQERVRRHREKDRAREQPRGRENNPYLHLSASAQISAAAGALNQYAEHKLSVRCRPWLNIRLYSCLFSLVISLQTRFLLQVLTSPYRTTELPHNLLEVTQGSKPRVMHAEMTIHR